MPGSEEVDIELMRQWTLLVQQAANFEAQVRDQPDLLAEDGGDEDDALDDED